MSVRLMKVLALCSGALVACAGGTDTQVLTGRVDTSKGALAIRAVSADDVVTATPVRTDGSFRLTLPAGTTYRLEVLTRHGVKNIVRRSGNVLRDLSFKVCQPVDPYDIGGVGDPMTDGLCNAGDPNCTPCDPATGMDCEQPLPPTCEPMDPNCACDIVAPDGTCCQANDPSCGPLPCMDPGDPNCCADGFCPPPCSPGDPNCCMPDASGNCEPPKPCDPTTDLMCCDANGTCGEPPPECQPGDPNCEPPTPCDPTTDPMCKCNADGTCPPLPCTGNDPSCGGCDDPNAPGCAPPCDPTDPTTCKDPCADDPASCGCMIGPSGDPSGDPGGDPSGGPNGDASGQANCWPEPQPCCDASGTTCDPSDGMAPDNVPGDFGCEGM